MKLDESLDNFILTLAQDIHDNHYVEYKDNNIKIDVNDMYTDLYSIFLDYLKDKVIYYDNSIEKYVLNIEED